MNEDMKTEQEVRDYFDKHPALKICGVGCLGMVFIALVALLNGIVLAFELLPLAIMLVGR